MTTRSDYSVPFWRRRGVRWGGAVALLFGFFLLSIFELIYWRATAFLLDTLDRSVTEQLELLAARPPELLPFMIRSRMNGGPAVITQVGLFAADGAPEVGDLAAIPPGLRLDSKVRDAIAADGTHHIRAAGRVLPDGSVLVVARDATEIVEVRDGFVNAGTFVIVPALVISLVSGVLVGVMSERRLRRLNATAERIIGGELQIRLPSDPDGDELDKLCAIVNRILTRLEEGVAALRNAGENIAHDLRTPLTVLRARLERTAKLAGEDSAIGKPLIQAIGNVDQTLSTITALLRIADLQHGNRVAAFAPFDIAAVLREASEIFLPVAEECGILLSLSLEEAAPINGDRELMMEAVANLLDNAIKFIPSGGRVEVALRRGADGPLICIADTGPGIPLPMREAVLRRFVRLDVSRNTEGRGLGLSLVKAICALHEFKLHIQDNDPGCKIIMECIAEIQAI